MDQVFVRGAALALILACLLTVPQPAHADEPVTVHVRDYTPCPDWRLSEADCDGQDGQYLYFDKPINPSTTALILVDVWADHGNPDLAQRIDDNVRDYLGPLLEAVRTDGRFGAIIHYKNGHELNHRIIPQAGEIVADDGLAVRRALLNRGIDTLIFAGYAANMCLTTRDATIISLYIEGWRNQIVIRDATVGIGAEDVTPDEAVRAAMLFLEINDYLRSATVADVQAALGQGPKMVYLPLVAKGE